LNHAAGGLGIPNGALFSSLLERYQQARASAAEIRDHLRRALAEALEGRA
jgi:hypothetical protein